LRFDLEAFSKHAKRKSVIIDDILLVTRRNPQLYVWGYVAWFDDDDDEHS
jgi:hypothetical protein